MASGRRSWKFCANVKRRFAASSRVRLYEEDLKYFQIHSPRLAESPFMSKQRKTQGFACSVFPRPYYIQYCIKG
jgi:hypothetical protein